MDKNEKQKKNTCGYIKQIHGKLNFTFIIILSAIIATLILLADYCNLISLLFESGVVIKIISTAVIVILVLCLVHIKPYKLLKNKDITQLDICNLIMLFSMVLYASLFTFVCGYNLINLIISLIIICLGIIFFIYRFFVYLVSFNKAKKEESKIVDFCEIYEYKGNKKYDLPILLDEKDVEYDLLGREFIIKQLVSSVKNYNTEGSYVIGLAGPWGSGKTTIINNAMLILKKENDNIIAINFNPWIYETQDSMLKAMFNAILKSTDVSYDSSFLNKIYKAAKQVMGLNEYSKTIANVLTGLENKEKYDFKIITEQISNFLAINNKYVVFIIDNIERATSDNVIFLFKLLGTLFDLKRVTYVLVYNKERLEEIFNDVKSIDSHYVEKIIQQELTVPAIDDNKFRDIYKTSFRNLLKIYNQSDEIDDSKYQPIYDFIYKKRMSLRDFKRLVNSTFPIVFSIESELYKPDLLSLQIVQFFDASLYNSIYENSVYFQSYDKIIDSELYSTTYIKESFNEDGKELLGKLFTDKNKSIIELLSGIFPCVNNYLNGKNIEPTNDHINLTEYQDVERNCRVCSAKYFYLYFSFSKNDYLNANESVSRFKKYINENKNTAFDEISKFLLSDNIDWQDELLAILNMRLDEFTVESQFTIAKFLTIYLDKFDHRFTFPTRSSYNSARYIIYAVIKNCSDSDFIAYMDLLKKNYSRLLLIENLINRMTEEQNMNNSLNSERIKKLSDTLSQMCIEITTQNINLYSDENYLYKNIWALYRYYDKHKDMGNINKYVATIIDKDTVFKVLWDITYETTGNQYGYAIEKITYDTFIGDLDISNKINAQENLTESQKTIKEIYNDFLKK